VPVSEAEPVVSASDQEMAPPSTKPSAAGAPRIDVSDDASAAEKIDKSFDKYELHDRDAEIADRVAAVLRSARLQVNYHFSSDLKPTQPGHPSVNTGQTI